VAVGSGTRTSAGAGIRRLVVPVRLTRAAADGLADSPFGRPVVLRMTAELPGGAVRRLSRSIRLFPERSDISVGGFPPTAAGLSAAQQDFLRGLAPDLRALRRVTCTGFAAGGGDAEETRAARRASAVCTALRRAGVRAAFATDTSVSPGRAPAVRVRLVR
jgi:hypothetical protein